MQHTANIEPIPAGPGAYLLAIDLGQKLVLDIATLATLPLAPGRYVYCGSAYSPGGTRASPDTCEKTNPCVGTWTG